MQLGVKVSITMLTTPPDIPWTPRTVSNDKRIRRVIYTAPAPMGNEHHDSTYTHATTLGIFRSTCYLPK